MAQLSIFSCRSQRKSERNGTSAIIGGKHWTWQVSSPKTTMHQPGVYASTIQISPGKGGYTSRLLDTQANHWQCKQTKAFEISACQTVLLSVQPSHPPAPQVYSLPPASTAAANWPMAEALMWRICRAHGSLAGVAWTLGQPPGRSAHKHIFSYATGTAKPCSLQGSQGLMGAHTHIHASGNLETLPLTLRLVEQGTGLQHLAKFSSYGVACCRLGPRVCS